MPANPVRQLHLSPAKSMPEVTIRCGFPVWYRYRFVLWKPDGQLWPDGRNWKDLHIGVFDKTKNASDTFPIGFEAKDLNGYSLSCEVYIKVPGGGSAQYSVDIDIKQDGKSVGTPFTENKKINNVKVTSDFIDFIVP